MDGVETSRRAVRVALLAHRVPARVIPRRYRRRLVIRREVTRQFSDFFSF